MVKLFEKKNGKFYIKDKELPTHIDGKKVLDVVSIKKNGIIHPLIELENDEPIITTIDNKQTIKVKYIRDSEKKHCKLIKHIFHKDEWYVIDKETYLKSIFEVVEDSFEIDIKGEIIIINNKQKDYIINKLKGGE